MAGEHSGAVLLCCCCLAALWGHCCGLHRELLGSLAAPRLRDSRNHPHLFEITDFVKALPNERDSNRPLRLQGGSDGGSRFRSVMPDNVAAWLDDNMSHDSRRELGYTSLGLGGALFFLVCLPIPILGVFMNRRVSPRNPKIL